MSRSYRWYITVAAALALAFAAPVSAQQAPAGDAGVAPIIAVPITTTPIPAATREILFSLAPLHAFESIVATGTVTDASFAPIPRAMTQRQSVALMIVGGAGMIVGSIIDGDTGTIIMVGGGVVGLVGLFQYLR